MPEGHTLHRLAHRLEEVFAGSVLRVGSPQGRFAESAARLDGLVLERAEAWGKHLFLTFDPDLLVHVHLGLYGTFAVHDGVGEVPDPVGQVRLRLVRVDGTAYADLRGATACELMTAAERDAVLDRIGPDPLRVDQDPMRAWERIRRSRAPIGGLLMDQSVIAGIGNVYRAEVLFRHRLDPLRPGHTLRVGRFRSLWQDLVELMADGVRTGRIETVRPEHQHAAETPHYVYRRTGRPCYVCGARVRSSELQGRNLFWCPRCQPTFRSRALT